MSSADDNGSVSDGSVISGVSDTSDGHALVEFEGDNARDEGVNDLLEHNKGIQDAAFSALHRLTKNRASTSLKWTALRVLVEFLQMFCVIFNSTLFLFKSDVWIIKAFSWLLFRNLVLDKGGYGLYVSVFYVIAITIICVAAVSACFGVLFKSRDQNSESSWMRRLVKVTEFISLFAFGIMWTAVMDYVAFLFYCRWSDIGSGKAMHYVFTDQNCIAMPHLAHMAFAGVIIVLHAAMTLALSFANCDLNPLTRNLLGSPAAAPFLKCLALKMVIVLASVVLQALDTAQPIIMLVACIFICYILITTTPYFVDWLNHAWFGLWVGLFYTCALLTAVSVWTPMRTDLAYRELMTLRVLWGFFPVVVGGVAASFCLMRYNKRPLKELAVAFADPSILTHLKDAYRFKSPEQVELLARVMRKWDEDGLPDAQATAFAEFILKAGMARYPSSPFLLILYANFLIEVRKDGQVSRTHLQLAAKNNPSLFDRYFAYACQELAKQLRAAGDGGMDLLSYVEFQRNFRACVRAHKQALACQQQFWRVLLSDTIAFADLQRSFKVMEKAKQQGLAVYKRTTERYPNNGRLVKIYGRFLEWVCDDPWAASRQYHEALRLGLTESIMGLSGSSGDGDDAPSRLVKLAGAIDEKTDGLVIVSSDGIIMMINSAGCRMFGYAKGELEGKNVSCLMPPPYSTHHNTFMARYAATGKANIMDTLTQLVGLHKDRSICPISLAVTKLSGTGTDSVFMGLIRLLDAQPDAGSAAAMSAGAPVPARVWCSAQGVILCAEQRVADVLGYAPGELVAKPMSSLSTEVAALDKFILAAASREAGASRTMRSQLLHKYLPPTDVNLTLEVHGTEMSLIVVSITPVVHAQDALLVLDGRGTICHITSRLAWMLGYPMKALLGGPVQVIMPPPLSPLHTVWLKDMPLKAPATSCRTPGSVVHLLGANKTLLPVTLDISSHDDGQAAKFVVKVHKAAEATQLDQRRLVLTLDIQGTVLKVNDGATKALFGFNPSVLVGKRLADFVDVFGQWTTKYGEEMSLLRMLVNQAQEHGRSSVRVGVKSPEHASKSALSAGFLTQSHTTKAAVMVVEPIVLQDDDTLIGNTSGSFGAASIEGGAAGAAVLEVQLWRPENLSAVLEVDSHMSITKAETGAGLIFGLESRTLLRQSLTSLVPMAGVHSPADLMAALNGTKKGLMKTGGAWRVGPIRLVDARHADGGPPVALELQAVAKDEQQRGGGRTMIRLRVTNPSLGSIDVLEHLKTAGSKSVRLDAGLGHISDGEDEPDAVAAPFAGLHHADSIDSQRSGLHHRLPSRLPSGRTQEWVKHTSTIVPDGDEADGAAHIVVKAPAGGKAAKFGDFDNDSASEASGADGAGYEQLSDAGTGPLADAGPAAASGDDLSADWRRAKRLKKLKRMMTSSVAQAPASRFSKHTKIIVATVLMVHVACFAVLVTQVADRNQNAYDVRSMAYAAEKPQRVCLQSNIVQKCANPVNKKYASCTDDQIATFMSRVHMNTGLMRFYHQGLYLGFNGLRPFKDKRILDYWTFNQLPELNYDDKSYNGGNTTASLKAAAANNTFSNSTASLWQMGNRFLTAADQLWADQPKIGYGLMYTSSWQYVYNNGLEGLLQGYSWSLDTFVDFCYKELLSLNTVALIVLIVETLVVLVACMAWECILLMAANSSHIRQFSVFLALPSATIRAMATQRTVVDDEGRDDDADDEESEEMAVAAEQATATDAGRGSVSKKVQMVANHAHQASDRHMVPYHGTGAGHASRAEEHNVPRGKRQQGLLDRVSRQLKALFHRSNMNFRMNGKKLHGNGQAVTRVMVPLMLWVATVLIIYGISFQRLSNLVGPLVSLDASGHVLYRLARMSTLWSGLAFETSPAEKALYREKIYAEVIQMRADYNALLYGGNLDAKAAVTFDTTAPSATFSDEAIKDIFFTTTACLRINQTACFKPGTTYYDVSRHGIDPMMVRFLNDAKAFADLPDDKAMPDHPLFLYSRFIGVNDLYDGMQTASGLFVAYTVSKFDEVNQLHIILLAITVVCTAAFVIFMFVPYTRALQADSKKIAGLLSALPAAVDVESHVRSVVLGIKPAEGRSSISLKIA